MVVDSTGSGNTFVRGSDDCASCLRGDDVVCVLQSVGDRQRSRVSRDLVCLVIHRSRRLQSTTNYFVISLAAADLLLSIVVMPFALTQELSEIGLPVVFWPPSSACKFIRFCQQLVPASTSFVFVAISVDRFYAVVYPLRFVLTRGRAQRLVVAIWSPRSGDLVAGGRLCRAGVLLLRSRRR